MSPLLAALGGGPTFFTAHHAGRGVVLLFVASLVLVPPLACHAVWLLARRFHRRAGLAVLLVLIGGLGALALSGAVPYLRHLSLPAFAAVTAALATAIGILYVSTHAARRLTAATWFSPIVFLLVFLLASPASAIFFSKAEQVSDVTIEAPVSLVMIVFDEFPLAAILGEDLEIDRRRFPGFSQLADLSTWYRGATTVSRATHRAVPALLTGRLPAADTESLPTADAHPRNLFRMLAGTHEFSISETITSLCPGRLCRTEGPRWSQMWRDTAIVAGHALLPERWASSSLPPIGDRWADFHADRPGWPSLWDAGDHALARNRPRSLESFVDRVDGIAPPTLHFAHIVLPHRPYTYLPDGRTYLGNNNTPEGAILNFGSSDGPWAEHGGVMAQMRQRLLLQLQMVDREMARLADQLTTPEHQQTMVVLVADHGVSLEASTLPRHPDAEFPDPIASVPLFVRYPGQRTGAVVDGPAEITDIVPTVADVMGAAPGPDWEFDGASLLDPIPARDRALHDDPPIPVRANVDLRRMVDDFNATPIGRPDDPSNLFALGPASALAGRRATDIPSIARGPGLSAARVDRGRGRDGPEAVSASLVEFTISGVPKAEWGLAVIDGVVAGTGPVYESDDGYRFAAMVDPQLLGAAGGRDVQVALWRESGEIVLL